MSECQERKRLERELEEIKSFVRKEGFDYQSKRHFAIGRRMFEIMSTLDALDSDEITEECEPHYDPNTTTAPVASASDDQVRDVDTEYQMKQALKLCNSLPDSCDRERMALWLRADKASYSAAIADTVSEFLPKR